MNIEEVISVNKVLLNNYFRRIPKANPAIGKIYYPNLILVAECENFFIVEFCGASEDYEELKFKKHRFENVNSYLYQFNQPNTFKPKIHDELDDIVFTNFMMGSSSENENADGRFKVKNLWGTRIINNEQGKDGRVFTFGYDGDVINYLEYNNCCFVNNCNNIYRFKPVQHLHIIYKGVNKSTYKRKLLSKLKKEKHYEDCLGITFVSFNDLTFESYALYSQFMNIYSFSNIRETTIGEFLNQNISIMEKVFSSKKVFYEPNLKWIEGNEMSNEVEINPDFLIEREDGYFDICDLKLPLWNKDKLTKGEHKRRNFLSVVEDAIAQLANYEEYFKFDKNIEHAKSKYGVQIKDPKLIIIIGNYYNYNIKEISEASRKLKSNYLIIDYDTLNTKFLASFKSV